MYFLSAVMSLLVPWDWTQSFKHWTHHMTSALLQVQDTCWMILDSDWLRINGSNVASDTRETCDITPEIKSSVSEANLSQSLSYISIGAVLWKFITCEMLSCKFHIQYIGLVIIYGLRHFRESHAITPLMCNNFSSAFVKICCYIHG